MSGFNTSLLHDGVDDYPNGATLVPIYQSSAFKHESAEELERIFDNKAIIREVHVYGQSLKLGEKGDIQHKGLGKWLMGEAEKIVKGNKIKELKVISGIGVREYYKKLGYELDKTYMIKFL